MIGSLIFGIIALVLIFLGLRIVQQYEKGVVFNGEWVNG